ncbi:AAA family ATPase, partial [Bacteriovoracaceae bacterium]|nr:AAA family ATPase [Bacteriovoracaceae bacterium]
MQINDIKLHPFKGISNQTYSFTPGLNILKGPNEMGKTTLYQALKHTLFTPASHSHKHKNFFPLGGGNTVNTTLTMIDESPISITKSWGENKTASMTIGDHFFTGDQEVQKNLESLLPVKNIVADNAFFGNQFNTEQTMSTLKNNTQLRDSLKDILLNRYLGQQHFNVMEFLSKVESEYIAHYTKWDLDKGSPQLNHRGERYKNNQGKLATNYFQWKDLERKNDQTLNVPKQLQSIQKSLTISYAEKKEIQEILLELGQKVTKAKVYAENQKTKEKL